MPFAAAWMYIEIIILSEVSQKDKDKDCMISTYIWNLKYNKKDFPGGPVVKSLHFGGTGSVPGRGTKILQE